MEENIVISKEEYEKLKSIEQDTTIYRQKLHPIYDKISIPVKVLDGVIVGGILIILAAVIYGVVV